MQNVETGNTGGGSIGKYEVALHMCAVRKGSYSQARKYNGIFSGNISITNSVAISEMLTHLLKFLPDECKITSLEIELEGMDEPQVQRNENLKLEYEKIRLGVACMCEDAHTAIQVYAHKHQKHSGAMYLNREDSWSVSMQTDSTSDDGYDVSLDPRVGEVLHFEQTVDTLTRVSTVILSGLEMVVSKNGTDHIRQDVAGDVNSALDVDE